MTVLDCSPSGHLENAKIFEHSKYQNSNTDINDIVKIPLDDLVSTRLDLVHSMEI